MLDDSAYADLCSAVTLQSNENGFFRNMADDMVEMAGPEWLRHFAALRCDRDRVAECVTDSRVRSETDRAAPRCTAPVVRVRGCWPLFRRHASVAVTAGASRYQ